jgi:YD repeat-containing protein
MKIIVRKLFNRSNFQKSLDASIEGRSVGVHGELLNRYRRGDRLTLRWRILSSQLAIMLILSISIIGVVSLNQSKLKLRSTSVSNVTTQSQYWVATTGSSGYPEIVSYQMSNSSSGISLNQNIDDPFPSNCPLGSNGAEDPTDLVASQSGNMALLTADSTSGSGSDAFLISSSNGSPTLLNDFCDVYGGDFTSAAVTPSGDYAFFTNSNAATSSQFGGMAGLSEVDVSQNAISTSVLPTTDIFSVAVCGGSYVVAGGGGTIYSYSISGSSLNFVSSTTITGDAQYISCSGSTVTVWQSAAGLCYWNVTGGNCNSVFVPYGINLSPLNTNSMMGSGLYLTDQNSNVWLANGPSLQELKNNIPGAKSAYSFAGNDPVFTTSADIYFQGASAAIPSNTIGSGGEAVGFGLQVAAAASQTSRNLSAGDSNNAQSANNCAGRAQSSQTNANDPAASSNISQSKCNSYQKSSGKPVDSATGNFTYSLPGISVPGIGPALSFDPTYNSSENGILGSSAGNFDIGYGFSSSPNVGLSVSGSTATITQENGAQVIFTQAPCPTGTYELDPSNVLLLGTPWCSPKYIQAGFYSNTTNQSDPTYSFVRLAPTYEVFTYCDSTSGCTVGSNTYTNLGLESIANQNGEEITITDIAGGTGNCPTGDSCIEYFQPNGQTTDRTVFVTQNSLGQVTELTDGVHSETFLYCTSNSTTCATGDLQSYELSMTAPTGGTVSTPYNLIWTFSYDETNNLNAINKIVDPNGNTLTNTYADSTTVTACQGAFGWVDAQTDAMSNVTQFSYCGYDTTTLTGDVEIIDPNNNVTLLAYANGALVGQTKGYGTPNQSTTIWFRDPSTQMVEDVFNPNGNIDMYTVDTYGRVTSFTDAMGNQSFFNYDESSLTASDFMHFYIPNWYTSAVPVYEATPPNPSEVVIDGFDTNGNLTCTVQDTDATSSGTGSSYTVTPDETGANCSDADSDSSATTPEPVSKYVWCTTSCPSGYLPGELESTSDPNNNITTYSYDSSGDLTSVTNALGDKQTYVYCSENSPYGSCTQTLSGGFIYSYAPGQLENEISANGASCSGSSCVPYTTYFAYSPENQIVEQVSPQNTSGISDVKFNTYDGDGNLTIEVDETGGSSTSTATAPVITTTNEYNADNVICWTTTQSVSNPSCSTIPSGSNTKSYSYDNDMNLTSITDANNISSKYTYDSQNQLSSQTLNTGTTINYAYDQSGNVLAANYSTGISNLYSYNADNEVTSRTENEPGDLATVLNSSCGGYIPFYGVYSTYCATIGRDINGNPVFVSGNPGQMVMYSPSNVSSLTGISCASQQVCFATGAGSSSTADPILFTTTNSGTSWSSVSASYPTGTTSLGQISCPSTTVCLAAAVSSQNEILYSSNGGSTWSQLTGTGAPTWPITSISCPSTTECYFAGNSASTGELTQWISGNTTPFVTQSFANVNISSVSCSNTSQCVSVGSSTSSAIIEETTGSNSWSSVSLPSGSSYSQLLSVSCPLASTLTNCYATGTNTSSNAVISQISYSGSAWSSVDQSLAIPYGTGSLFTIGCGYGSTCMALGDTQFNSGQILYTSNSGTSWPSQIQLAEYGYTTEGHLAYVEDGIGTTGILTYSYDPLGRIISQTNEYGVTTEYTYDLDSNMTSITYPTNNKVIRTFNSANELTSVQTWLNGPGTCGTYSEPTDTTNFTYDANGDLTSEQFPTCDTKNTTVGPDVVNFSYNDNNHMNKLSGLWQGTNYSVAYSNNGAGMIYQRSVMPASNTTSYNYNNLGQISSVSNPNETFQYDNAGNMTCNQSGQYQTYNNIGELNYAYQTCGSTANQQDSFTYDAYGDRTQEMFPWDGQSEPENYIYVNSLGEMVSYQIFFTATNYIYSGTDQLMQITQNSTTSEQLTWNEASSTPEILADSNWDFIYGPGNQVIEAIQISNSQQHYLVNDPTGSPLINFSQDGTINNPNLYNTYGGGPGSGAPPIGWDNAYYDSNSSLYYMDNRFYDATTGQFITQDLRILALNQPYSYAGVVSPISGGLATNSDPLFANNSNPYQFANDNPTNETDPTGLCATCSGPSFLDWVGVGLGVVSTVTGIASIAADIIDPGLGELLGGTSVVTGFGATALDGNDCINGIWQACVGMGLGIISTASGGADLLGSKFSTISSFLDENNLTDLLPVVATVSGGAGAAWDAGNTVYRAITC